MLNLRRLAQTFWEDKFYRCFVCYSYGVDRSEMIFEWDTPLHTQPPEAQTNLLRRGVWQFFGERFEWFAETQYFSNLKCSDLKHSAWRSTSIKVYKYFKLMLNLIHNSPYQKSFLVLFISVLVLIIKIVLKTEEGFWRAEVFPWKWWCAKAEQKRMTWQY